MKYVAFQLVGPDAFDDNSEVDFCVLRKESLNHRAETDEFTLSGDERQLPRSGVFDLDYAVWLVSIDRNVWSERENSLEERLDTQLNDLLDCVYRGKATLSELAAKNERVDLVVLVDHASGEEQTIGGCAASDVAGFLDQMGCSEVLLLSCRGGCESMASKVSTEKRIVVSPARVIDTRKAYIFGLFYIWKRFGEGWSAAQTVGSQPVAGNDFRLLHAGRSI